MMSKKRLVQGVSIITRGRLRDMQPVCEAELWGV